MPFLQKSYVTWHTRNSYLSHNLEVPCNNLLWWFYQESEHISPEQPYRLKPKNRAQTTRDSPGDISGDISFDIKSNTTLYIAWRKCHKSCSKWIVKAIRRYRLYLLTTYNCHYHNRYPIPYSLAYDRQCIFSSASCFQGLSNKHSSRAR